MSVDTGRLRRYANALPFADEKAGLDETAAAMRAAADEIDQLRAGLPAFQVAQQAELDHAYSKHGREPWSRHEFWGVLDEEVMELKQAIMSNLSKEHLLTEALQIACVCQRYAETGDRYDGPHPHVRFRSGGMIDLAAANLSTVRQTPTTTFGAAKPTEIA